MKKVYLVGAGCGSLDLYTVKALKCIKKAECIIYDQLIDKSILDLADCEKIYVGKIKDHHTLSQDKINELLVSKAKQYNTVVRLKGGDVFVFGRGGEEGEYLYKNNIDFEVVPGISSAIGGLAYAGIPVTHRGLSGGFQVYTGALKKGKKRQFDFSKMLDDYTTYIFLMSMHLKEDIINGFLKAGKDPKTPVAIVTNVSLTNQKCLYATLETILQLEKQDSLPTPGIIVVGDVVKMHEILNFYQRKPLFGKNILVTVVGHDHYLKEELTELGANVHEVMTGKIEYLEVELPEIKDNLVFTSQHGVTGFMNNYLKQYKDVRHLYGTRIIAIGKKTNEKLNQYGLNADFIPSKSTGKVLNEEIKKLIKDEKLYVVKGDVTSITLNHHSISVYTNKETEIKDNKQNYDYALFTCASSMYRLFKQTNITANTYISMGPATTKAIQDCFEDVNIIELVRPDKKEMVEAILKEENYVL